MHKRESLASWLGINRASLAVLVAIAGLGLSEEIWTNFFGIQIHDIYRLRGTSHDAILSAAFFIALKAFFVNLVEGIGYILGGTIAHKLGARIALAVSATPMLCGFSLMLAGEHTPVLLVCGALFVTSWEPLSVPATFEVVGAEVPKNRRTIAFAVQSIQKRLPKVIGPILG